MHVPVMVREVLTHLAPTVGETAVDATVNRGGHAKEICGLLGPTGILFGLDRDHHALNEAARNLADCAAKVILRFGNFRDLGALLADSGIQRAQRILFDLGTSTEQLKSSGRGFSFQQDEPLLMTYESDQDACSFTAADIVNDWSEEVLANIIFGYGEERFARRIARNIVAARKIRRLGRTADLVAVIKESVPANYERGRIHPATRTFQALRIAVNDELNALREGLKEGWKALAPGGRMAIISFHSLEARTAKTFFGTAVEEEKGRLITPKPVFPSVEEVARNPRSRSAQLRVIEKI